MSVNHNEHLLDFLLSSNCATMENKNEQDEALHSSLGA